MTAELVAQPTPPKFQHHVGRESRPPADALARLYEAAYIGTPQETNPFYSRERFLDRLAGYSAQPGFELVTAEVDDELVGYIFGYTLQPTARWWNGVIDPVPEGFVVETGRRTFAINELHVRADHRGEGIASRLHRELIDHRVEERATILVRPDNPARATYLRWGYKSIGRLQPYPDSPVFDALVLPLNRC